MAIGRKILLTATFIGSVLIFTALAAYRPGDFGHVVSEANLQGGKVRHGLQFSYGTPRCSVLVTSKAKLDRIENLNISVEGANPPPFEIIGRNPSVFNMGIHKWPEFVGDTINGVQPGEKFAFYVVFRDLEKDPVCGMWASYPDSGDTKEFKGKSYKFCSVDCMNAFTGNPANFAEKPVPPEKCNIVVTDSQQRKVLTVPVDFSDPRSAAPELSASASSAPSDCHDGGATSGSGHPSKGKKHHD